MCIRDSQNGVTHDSKAEELASAQICLVDYLVLTRQFAHAAEIFDSIAPPMRATNRGDLLADEIQISAHTGTLANWLAAYQKSLDANGDQAGEQSEPGDELDTLASQEMCIRDSFRAPTWNAISLRFMRTRRSFISK